MTTFLWFTAWITPALASDAPCSLDDLGDPGLSPAEVVTLTGSLEAANCIYRSTLPIVFDNDAVVTTRGANITFEAPSITLQPGAIFADNCIEYEVDEEGEVVEEDGEEVEKVCTAPTLNLIATDGDILSAGHFGLTGTNGDTVRDLGGGSQGRNLTLTATGSIRLERGSTFVQSIMNCGVTDTATGGDVMIEAQGDISVLAGIMSSGHCSAGASETGRQSGTVRLNSTAGNIIIGESPAEPDTRSLLFEANGKTAGSIEMVAPSGSIEIRSSAALETIHRTAAGVPGTLYLRGESVTLNGTFEAQRSSGASNLPGGQVWVQASRLFQLGPDIDDEPRIRIEGKNQGAGGTARIEVFRDSTDPSESGIQLSGSIVASSSAGGGTAGEGGVVQMTSGHGIHIDGRIDVTGGADEAGGQVRIIALQDIELGANSNIQTGDGAGGRVFIQNRADRSRIRLAGSLSATGSGEFIGDDFSNGTVLIDACNIEVDSTNIDVRNGALVMVSRSNSYTGDEAGTSIAAEHGAHFRRPGGTSVITGDEHPDFSWFASGIEVSLVTDECIATCAEREPTDADGDGAHSVWFDEEGGTDCDDTTPYIHPAAPEAFLADGVDANCSCEEDDSVDGESETRSHAYEGFLRRLDEDFPEACDIDSFSPDATAWVIDDCPGVSDEVDPSGDTGAETTALDTGDTAIEDVPDTGEPEDHTGTVDSEEEAEEGDPSDSTDPDESVDGTDTAAATSEGGIRGSQSKQYTTNKGCHCAAQPADESPAYWALILLGVLGLARRHPAKPS